MQRSVVVICLLVVLPLIVQAGNIGKVKHMKADYDYDEGKPTKEANEASEANEDSPGGGMEEEKEGPIVGPNPMNRPLFDIPANMTEDEWRKIQYENFQKLKYNEWQKKQFEEFEKQRFVQWQVRRWEQSQIARQQEIAAQHQVFVQRAGIEMQKEQEKHHNWLQNLLNNPKERAALMKDIEEEEQKEL